MELSKRQKEILRAIVENYIETAEPVGSKSIAQGLGVSSATIRNEMAELTSQGYLEQPHTSAGRVPSAAGYRVYVNELMDSRRVSEAEAAEITQALDARMQQLDRIISDAGKLTSQLTSYPAYVMAAARTVLTVSRFDLLYVDASTFIIVVMLSNNTVKNKLVHLPCEIDKPMLTKLATVFNVNFTGIPDEEMTQELIAAVERSSGDQLGLVAVIAGFAIQILTEAKRGEVAVAGATRLLAQPEYQDVEKAHRLMNYLSDNTSLVQLPAPETDKNLKITIGPENVAEELKDSSVVVARYDIGNDMQGLIGVVGPTRMDYAKVAAQLQYIAGGLSNLLAGGQIPQVRLPDKSKNDNG